MAHGNRWNRRLFELLDWLDDGHFWNGDESVSVLCRELWPYEAEMVMHKFIEYRIERAAESERIAEEKKRDDEFAQRWIDRLPVGHDLSTPEGRDAADLDYLAGSNI